MELIANQEDKHLTDPDSQDLRENNVAVAFSKTKSPFMTKRNVVIFTVFHIIIFVSVIIFILTFNKCPNLNLTSSKSNLSIPRHYLDQKNRPCFYQEIRLPKSVKPLLYNISIQPNLKGHVWKDFEGQVIIDGICENSTDFVVLHAKSLKLSKPQIKLDNISVSLLITSFCPKLDQYYLKFSRLCQVDERILISVSFHGLLEKRLDGFYVSEYKTKSGERALLTTHMEPTFARQAFPCFDEPRFKANFSLTMIRDENHYSLFNMPLKYSKKLSNGMYSDVFETSVKMSTYLVAYMVLPHDYIYQEGFASNNRIKVRIFAPSEKENYTSFALAITQKVLPFYENLFGLDYPLPKLDMIAIPDFSAGAMENWGLITYKLYSLLLNPKNPKFQQKTSIAKIISHEIAHQWFGNIVTMDWWNDLWLNEGFATYSEYLAADYISNDWNMMEHFYHEQIVDALNFDSLLNSHPIQVPVKDPQEIESIFDQISYGKGASLVRMLEKLLGMKALKAGLKIYLQRYRYKTAVSDNLWTSFSEAYFQRNQGFITKTNPITLLLNVMSTWLNQTNFPLVTFTRTGPKSFRITQERFLLLPNATKLWKTNYSTIYNYLWSIPIFFKTDAMSAEMVVWLNMKTSQEYELDNEFQWIKLNYGQTGFFRINYDNETWLSLIRELRNDVNAFSILDRSGLLTDAFTLVRAGKLSIAIAMDLALYLQNETHHIPWSIGTQILTEINKQLYFDDFLRKKFEKFAQKMIGHVLRHPRIGSWTTENLTSHEALTRLVVIQFALSIQQNDTIQEALKFYKKYKAKRHNIDSNLNYMSIIVGITEGGREEWNFIFDKLSKARDPEVQRGLRKALSKSRDVELLNKLFYTTMMRYKVQDVIGTLYEASQGQGVDQAWLFIQRNWNYFEKNFSQYFAIMDLFKICHGLMTETDYEQAKLFFSSKELGSGGRSAKQALEIIKSNIFWNQVNINPLRNWLNENVKDTTM